MKKALLLLASLLTFASCNKLMLRFYNIKDPEVETRKTIVKSATRYRLDTSNIVTVNSADFLHVMKGKAIPDAAIYDKSGKYIEYRKTDTSCNAGLFEFIPSLNLSGTYNQPGGATLDEELEKCRDLNSNTLAPRETADFYVLIYWTVWTGKLNKDHVKVWEDLAKNNKNCNVKVIKVNLDLQAYWNPKETEGISSAMGHKK